VAGGFGIVAAAEDFGGRRVFAEFAFLFVPGALVFGVATGMEDLAGVGGEVAVAAEEFRE